MKKQQAEVLIISSKKKPLFSGYNDILINLHFFLRHSTTNEANVSTKSKNKKIKTVLCLINGRDKTKTIWKNSGKPIRKSASNL